MQTYTEEELRKEGMKIFYEVIHIAKDGSLSYLCNPSFFHKNSNSEEFQEKVKENSLVTPYGLLVKYPYYLPEPGEINFNIISFKEKEEAISVTRKLSEKREVCPNGRVIVSKVKVDFTDPYWEDNYKDAEVFAIPSPFTETAQ